MNNYLGGYGQGEVVSTFRPSYPPSYKVTYYGTQADVNFSASVYYANQWTVEITSGNPYVMVATLNLETSGNGLTPITGSEGIYPTINWSLHYNTTTKDLLHAKVNMISWIGDINQQDKAQLTHDINNPSSSINWSSYSSASASVAAAQTIYNMYSAGDEDIPIYQQVLRETIIMPSSYDLTWYQTNLSSIYSKTTLASVIGIPTNWQNAMWDGTDPSSALTFGIPYHYGWQKQPPSCDQSGATITMVQEYYFGLWPQNIYGTVL